MEKKSSNSTNPLNKKTQKLFIQMHKKIDANIPLEKIEERTTLLNENYNLIHYTINRFFPDNTDTEDLEAIGVIALVKAVDKYSLEKNIAFSTYAVKAIHRNIKRNLELQKCDNKIISKFTVSLDAPIQTGNESDEDVTLHDTLITADENDVQNEFIEQIEKRKLYKYLKHLTPNEQLCLVYYFELYNNPKKDYNFISSLLKLSRARYYQLLSKAVEKLKILFGKTINSNKEFLIKRNRIKNKEYPIIKNLDDYKKYAEKENGNTK